MRGPNCYNVALINQKVLTQLSFTSFPEFKFYLNHLFQAIPPLEQLQPGDMGVIFEPIHRHPSVNPPVHAFTYISGDLIFEKGGTEAHDPLQFDSYDVVAEDYGIPDFSTWLVLYRRIPDKSIQRFASSEDERAIFKNFMNQIEEASHAIYLAALSHENEPQKIQDLLNQIKLVIDQIDIGAIKTPILIQALLHRIESISQDQEVWESSPAHLEQTRLLHSVKRSFQKMKTQYQVPSADSWP